MSEIEFRIESPSSKAAVALIAELDRELAATYPGYPVNGIDAAAFDAGEGVFVVGYVGGEPAATGAFRPHEDAAEIKRMFVARRHRGLGLSRHMLRFLECEAFRQGYRRGLLETGIKQVAAVALYESEGWKPTTPFGDYAVNPSSRCYGKSLEAG
jgi:GNAT superfamily N-acetyltransferase